MTTPPILDARAIFEVLPHRYPFLLVDRILELEAGVKAVGLKNVTANEPQFTGHFPARPIMPGVLIVEALAQVGAVSMLQQPEHRGRLGILAGIDNCRFRRQVGPGDQLILEVTIMKLRSSFGRCDAKAKVDGQVAAQAELLFSIID